MKVQHLILTCNKNYELQQAIRSTFAKDTDSYLFMGDQFDFDSIAHLGLPTGYQFVPFKLAYCIMSCNSHDEFDFYFFQDDDTYVDVAALKREILDVGLDPEKPQCLGKIFKNYTQSNAIEQGMPLQSLKGKDSYLPVDYPSGGAGFVLTRVGFKKIREYLRANPDFATAYNSDISIGFWMRNSSQFELIDSEKFRPDNSGYDSDAQHVTFHYMNSQKINDLYYRLLESRRS